MNSAHRLRLKCSLRYGGGNNLIWSSCFRNKGKRTMRKPFKKALALEKDMEAYRRDKTEESSCGISTETPTRQMQEAKQVDVRQDH